MIYFTKACFTQESRQISENVYQENSGSTDGTGSDKAGRERNLRGVSADRPEMSRPDPEMLELLQK